MMIRPVVDQIAWTVAVLLSGVAAGMFLMDFFGYYPVLPQLSDRAAVELHQASVALHRGIFRLTVRCSAVACIITIIFFSDGTSRWLLIGSLTCVIALVVYTNYGLIPLNQEILTWAPDALPTDWKVRFSQMIFRERLRSFLPALAFVLELLAWRR